MATSSDPNDAVVTVTWQSVSGNTVTTEQGSGVLIAPDEVLTADHVVLNGSGGVASGISVSGAVAGQAFSAAAAGVHASPAADWTQAASAAGDFALIHLAAPVAGAPTMALGADLSGAVTVTGYPRAAGEARASLDETLSPASGLAGVLQGTPLGYPGDPHGASGGPAWRLVGGTPTVVGLTSSASGSTGYFVGLTADDVAEVQGWEAADAASAPAASAAPAATVSTPAAVAGPAPTPADAGTELAAAAAGVPAFASHPAIDAALARVAAVLTRDVAALGAGAGFDDVAAYAMAGLGDNGNHRNLAAALLEGAVWGHDGGAVGAAVAAVGGSDPGITHYAVAKQAARAGALAGRALLFEGH